MYNVHFDRYYHVDMRSKNDKRNESSLDKISYTMSLISEDKNPGKAITWDL